jgi:hypothetical protein
MRSRHPGHVGRSAVALAALSLAAMFVAASPLASAATAPAPASAATPAAVAAGGPAEMAVPTPADYLGFPVGADRKLADYTQVRGYFESLAAASPWIKVWTIGQTTLDKPFIMAVMSRPENLANLPRYIEISKRLADPRGLSEDEAARLAREGKAFIMITCNLHSTEIGSAQAALELAYDIAAQKSPVLSHALENAVFFLVPSLNPDGLQMVVDWYKKWLGTEYEGCRLPWLYHYYAGHDDNRDWWMADLRETRAMLDVYYRTVVPQVIFDMHQMDMTGARLFLPPYTAPANPNLDPAIIRGTSLIGCSMQLACEEAGLAGVISNAYFDAYWEGSSEMTPWWHNQLGILSEMASVNVASPIYVEPGELSANEIGFPRYEYTINFPHPWPGGWWRLRDIVDYELTIATDYIRFCAENKERILNDFYQMGMRGVEKGTKEPPFAFVIPTPFRDPVTAAKLAEVLMIGGVEVRRAKADFKVGDKTYRAGSYVMFCDQPYRAYLKDLLEVQDYPDIRASKKEPFSVPYDVTAWTLPMQFGVACETINDRFSADTELLTTYPWPRENVPGGAVWGYALRPEVTESCHAVNLLLKKGFTVYRADGVIALAGGDTVSAGAFLVPGRTGVAEAARSVASRLHVEFQPLSAEPKVRRHELKPLKVALFKPWLASMDEGWTRYLFDSTAVQYKNVTNAEVKKNAIKDYDVLVFTDEQPSVIRKGKPTGEWARFFRPMPPEYSGGIDSAGVVNVKKFVKDGGTLICLGSSCDFAIEALELPVSNVLSKVSKEDFACPGAILKVSFKQKQPITYGMPPKGFIFFNDSPAFQTTVPYGDLDRTVLASYTEKDPRASGLIIGGDRLYRRAALVEIKKGKGTVVLFGFAPQNRCQTLGTYKLLLNAILEGKPKAAKGAQPGRTPKGAGAKTGA